jgi:hypothetical protein
MAGVVDGWDPQQDAKKVLAHAVTTAFDGDTPKGLHEHIGRGNAAAVLITASHHTDLLSPPTASGSSTGRSTTTKPSSGQC